MSLKQGTCVSAWLHVARLVRSRNPGGGRANMGQARDRVASTLPRLPVARSRFRPSIDQRQTRERSLCSGRAPDRAGVPRPGHDPASRDGVLSLPPNVSGRPTSRLGLSHVLGTGAQHGFLIVCPRPPVRRHGTGPPAFPQLFGRLSGRECEVPNPTTCRILSEARVHHGAPAGKTMVANSSAVPEFRSLAVP